MSVGGVFFNRGQGHGRSFHRYRETRKREKRQKLEQFAEALADGMTITAAAGSCEVSQQTGSIYLRDICHGLGCQATCQDAACRQIVDGKLMGCKCRRR